MSIICEWVIWSTLELSTNLCAAVKCPEKAPTRAFSLLCSMLKVPISTFTIQNLGKICLAGV